MNDKHSVTWRGPSACSADSMPLGGCDMGCNVWVEAGQVMVYACESGGYDENGTLLKLGRLRLKLDGLDLGADMTQTLLPTQGRIEIREGDSCIALWAAADKPELHIEYSGPARAATLVYDSWRWRDRDVAPDELGQCRDMIIFGPAVTRADTVRAADGEVLCFHDNGSNTFFPKLIAEQHLEGVRDSYRDRLTGRISGGLVRAPHMRYEGTEPYEYAGVDARSYVLRGNEPRADWRISFTALCCQCADAADWEARLRSRADAHCDAQATRAWWSARFERSFIDIDADKPDSSGYAIARNYALCRYMQLCNHAGAFPTKFNGGLFTFDEGRTPDFRQWGGTSFTAQNQRLVYWPMLKNGDFDAMLPQFEFYRNITEGQKALTREAWRPRRRVFRRASQHIRHALCRRV